MSRRLNIERRRKRIRHYRAQRRRRSPAWRALLFWWGPALICSLTGLAVAQLSAEMLVHRVGAQTAAAWVPLQERTASLGFVHATQAEVDALQRRLGNVRRRVWQLRDADIGLSFEPHLPEPTPLRFKPLGPMPKLPKAAPETAAAPSLPPAAESVALPPPPPLGLRVNAEEPLRAARFAFEAKPPEGRGRAIFWVELNAEGRPTAVVRLEPAGEESAALRALRRTIESGRGAHAAQGIVQINWESEASP